jgi:hypothetical protein
MTTATRSGSPRRALEDPVRGYLRELASVAGWRRPERPLRPAGARRETPPMTARKSLAR